MLRFSILAFFGLFCLALGWESGKQYSYSFTGRSMTGMYGMKQQNAILEIQSRVLVQSQDDGTLAVKLSEHRIKRSGNYVDNPYFSKEAKEVQSRQILMSDIEGDEDEVADSEHLSAPFVIKHNKGSFVAIQVGADEPLWVVNFKKSIASQLQLDVQGVRPDGERIDVSKIMRSIRSLHDDKKQKGSAAAAGATIQVYEDTVTGDCSTTIAINRLTASQIYGHRAYSLASFDQLCSGKPAPRCLLRTAGQLWLHFRHCGLR
jgi:hypothetical protein